MVEISLVLGIQRYGCFNDIGIRVRCCLDLIPEYCHWIIGEFIIEVKGAVGFVTLEYVKAIAIIKSWEFDIDCVIFL